MIEPIKAAFTAGEVKTFMIQGEYLEVLEAAYPIDVVMMDRSGAQLSVMRNAEASYFSRPGRYEVVQVTSPQAQTVRIFIGSGDAGTRKTSGDVSVIDGGKSRTLAEIAFAGYGYVGAVAANLGNVQLWNPLDSGKNIVVETVRVFSATATLLYVGFNDAQLLTFDKKAKSKKTGGPESVADIRYEASAASIVGSGILYADMGPINQTRIITPEEPMIILPGYGLNVRTTAVNQDLAVNFEFYEDGI